MSFFMDSVLGAGCSRRFCAYREWGKWFLDYPFDAKHLSDTFDQNIVAVAIYSPI